VRQVARRGDGRAETVKGQLRHLMARPVGLDAQRAAVARFAEAEGFEIIAEHVEIETGKGSDALDRRPKLTAALAEARQ
jgi:hypothetical protein